MVLSLNQTFTCEGNEYVPSWKDILKAGIIVFVSIGIAVGNIVSVVVFNSKASKKVFLKKVRLTMNSLICTDLSMGLLMCPFCVYSALYKCWPFTETFCKVEALLLSALFHESTLSLVLIALDRYFSVHHYLRYNSFMTSRKYVVAILTTWFATFSVYSLVIFLGGQFYFDSIGVNCEPYYENRNVTITVLVLFYIIPALLFMYSYGSIFVAANRKRNVWLYSTHSRNSEHKNNAVTQILKTSKYLAAITMGFFIAVTPWSLCTLITAVTNIKLHDDVDFAVTWLAISNSFWNVVIYSIMNRKFRFAIRSLRSRNQLRNGNDSLNCLKLTDADVMNGYDSPRRLGLYKSKSHWRLSRSTMSLSLSSYNVAEASAYNNKVTENTASFTKITPDTPNSPAALASITATRRTALPVSLCYRKGKLIKEQFQSESVYPD